MSITAVVPADLLLQRWQDAWPQALHTWSRYTRLGDPRLCASRVEAASEGLDGSFAMIRLKDQRVVIDLERVRELGLEDYAVEILAHEIGHHVLVPANVSDQFRLLARMRSALPTLGQHAPMVANLYADLFINDRLQRQGGLRLADIYRKLAASGGRSSKGENGAVWNLYLRIYESLWKLEAGSLGAHKGDARSEGDAWLGARLVRVYANDWLAGAGRFATLLLHYLVEDANAVPHEAFRRLFDLATAAEGSEPFGGALVEPDEVDGGIHPADDPAITGSEVEVEGRGAPLETATKPSSAQAREPFEYGEILRAAGLRVDDHQAAVRYYRERALPYLVPFPQHRVPDSPEPQMEGLEPWEVGDPLDELDGLQSVLQSPRVVPGLTTVRRQYGYEPGQVPQRRPVDLDLYVDSSGSMPNPQQQVSYLSLAGAVIALSALRAGSRVQVTLWSGKNQFMHTGGFGRDEHAVLRVLTGFYGGATAFPIHLLRDAHCGKASRERRVHILMISDDGITTMFDRDERGDDGWDVAARSLTAAGGGGSMALNISPHWETALTHQGVPAYEGLLRARREQGWDIFAVSRLEDLMDFARSFSRRHYA